MLMRRMAVAAVVVAGLAWGARAHAATPMELVQQALRVQAQVRDYTANVTVTVSAPNVQVPARTVKVYYKAPDKLRVDSEGLVILPRDALLMGNLAKHLEGNMQASLVGTGTLSGRPVACIKLTPLDAGPGSGRLLCWIDTQYYLLLKSEVWNATSSAMTITFSYTRVQSAYWMPRTITCVFAARLLDSSGEQAQASISFANYQVNTGLSDSIFEDEG